MSSPASAKERTSVPLRSDANRSFEVWHLPEGKIPWVTLATILVSGLLAVLSLASKDSVYAVFYAKPLEIWTERKWFGILGSTLLHGGVFHLIFNVYWLWLFGRVLEPRLRALRYFGLLVALAWMSAIGEFAWAGALGIGLSGVVYGLFGFLWVNRSHVPAFADLVPNKIVGLFCGWLILCLALSYGEIYPVANAAHFAGLAAGVAMGAWWSPGPLRTTAQLAMMVLGFLSFVPLVWAPWQEMWCAAKAHRAMSDRDHEAALGWLAKIHAKNGMDEWARKSEAEIQQYRAHTAKYRSDLDRLGRDTKDAGVLNAVAWRLATSPDASLRDGVQAVVYAKRACETDGWKSPAYLDTLAAAHAETGNFNAAEMWARRALENPEGHEALLQKHLDAFLARQPVRQ